MSFVRLEPKPGVDVELSASANRGGWSESSMIRWREGRLERMRGRTDLAEGTTVSGICRSLHWWLDLQSVGRLAIGTHSHLQYWTPRTIIDITPAGLAPGLVSSDPGRMFGLRIWSLDNFGQDLLAVPSGGALYVWRPGMEGQPAAPVPSAPPHAQGGFMTMPQQIFFEFGAAPDGGTIDSLLCRWCDQSDYTVWQPATDNAAGSFRISRGSRIVGAVQGPVGAFLWTDMDIWSIQFEGQPLVFGFFQIASNCGLIAQHAMVMAGSTPYWMSDHGFFAMTGNGVQKIPCTVYDYVYLDLDADNQDKCFAALDYLFNELWWFFPSKSGGTGEIDSYVKFNVLDSVWDCGRLQMTAWTDQNLAGQGPPINVGLDGVLCKQDEGLDNDEQPIIAFARSGYQDLAEGEEMQFIESFYPDFIWSGTGPDGRGPRADITLFFRRFPEEPECAIGPFTIGPNIRQVTLAQPHPTEPGIIQRPRGREWAIRIDWNTSNSWCRWGSPRLLIAPDGRWS